MHKALGSVGFSSLYLNPQMTPNKTTNTPSGGKANLARLNSEVEALEGLILRFRS